MHEAQREKDKIKYKALDTNKKKIMSWQIHRNDSERRKKKKMTENTEKEHVYEMF